MTFTHKLSARLARLWLVFALTALVASGCELRRNVVDPGEPVTVEQVLVSPPGVTLVPAATADFVAVPMTASGDTAPVPVTWTVSGGALVDSGTTGGRHWGRYRAGTEPGTYRVIATAQAAERADTATVVVVPIPVASVDVTPASADLGLSGTVQLAAVAKDGAGAILSNRAMTWSSSSAQIATVVAGLVTAVGAGTAYIVATSEGKSDTATVVVTTDPPPPPAPVALVTVNPASATVATGQPVTLSATLTDSAGNVLSGRPVSWASAPTAVATVTSGGVVTGVAPGEATITATSEGKSGTATVTVPAPPPPPGGLPAFPGAVGFGSSTPAGRGGAVLRVTNLNDNGAGSLRAALSASGPRTVIFEVSGTIVLASDLSVSQPYLTVAGQTAPSPGITLRGAGLIITGHDVLVQHVRIRVGDDPGGPDPGVRDGFRMYQSAYNVVLDHVSISWGVDENGGTSTVGSRHDLTITNSIISEGLNRAGHPETEHSKGVLIGQGTMNMWLSGNLFAHNVDRNPYIKGNTAVAFVNNVVYNHGKRYAVQAAEGEYGALRASVVGNVFIPGVNTEGGGSLPIQAHSTMTAASKLYVADNARGSAPAPSDPWSLAENEAGSGIIASSPPIWIAGFLPQPSAVVQAAVLANAGARPGDRDAVDARIVSEVLTRTGSIIDSPSERGGWPTLATNVRALTLPANPNGDDDGDGYTNVEEWLHQMAALVEGR